MSSCVLYHEPSRTTSQKCAGKWIGTRTSRERLSLGDNHDPPADVGDIYGLSRCPSPSLCRKVIGMDVHLFNTYGNGTSGLTIVSIQLIRRLKSLVGSHFLNRC